MHSADRRYTIRRGDDRAILAREEVIQLRRELEEVKAEVAELKESVAFHGGYDDRTYTIND